MKDTIQTQSHNVKQVHQLETAGLSDKQAHAIIEVVGEMLRSALDEAVSRLATKEELEEIRTEMATKDDLEKVRAEMATKDDLMAMKDSIDKKFFQMLLWMTTLIIGMTFAILGYLPYLAKLMYGI